MGLVYQTSKWLDILWGQHLEVSAQARELVKQGIDKQGPTFAGFPADVHGRLYLPSDPAELSSEPEWAVRLHRQSTGLGEWQRLRLVCSRNGFAAGIAAEVMLEQLLPLVPDRPEHPASPPTMSSAPSADPQSSDSGNPSPQATEQPGAPQAVSEPPGQPAPSDAELRAALRRAARTARDAVDNAEAGLEGVAGPLGFSGSGTATIRNSGPADLKAIRDAHSRLTASSRLRKIAELAGRLERVAASKARSRVRPGVGEVHGVGLGADLARLLPSELVGLRHPRLRLLTLAKLVEHRALVYSMEGREPQARGPIVLLLDESSSMNDGGRDIWSKAVCLALLSTATRQKRAWHLLAFNGSITREAEIAAGRATPADIQNALDHRCRGGTDFTAPVLRAVEIVRTSKTVKKADVVIVTDGEDSLTPEAIKSATELTSREGVSWYVVGVGPDADRCVESLGPIATDLVVVRRTVDDDAIVDVINLDSAA